MQYLTPENINLISLAILLFLGAWELIKILLRTFAPDSKNKIDDKVLVLINKIDAKISGVTESEWVKKNASKIWLIIEQLANTKATSLKGVAKLATALTVAKTAYAESQDKSLTEDGIKMLEIELNRISVESKANGTPN